MGRRKRRGTRKFKLFRLTLFTLALAWLGREAYHFWLRPEGRVAYALFAFALASLTVWRVKRALDRRARLRAVAISTDPRDYIITPHDFKRGSPKESVYRKIMQLPLLAIYGNRCAKCGVDDNGLDLDHFFLPKTQGGSFIMRHRDGHLVNNAVPLCESCNRRKSDRPFAEFFSEIERTRIFRLNVALTKRLNARGLLDGDGNVNPRRKSA